MSNFSLLILVHFLILMGPALVITGFLVRRMKRENFRDRRALAEMKLARLHGLAHPAKTRKSA